MEPAPAGLHRADNSHLENWLSVVPAFFAHTMDGCEWDTTAALWRRTRRADPSFVNILTGLRG